MSAQVWKGSKFSGFTVECLFVSTRRTINPLKIIKAISASALPTRLYNGDNTAGQSVTTLKNGAKKVIDVLQGFANNVADGAGALFGFDSSNAKKQVSGISDYSKGAVDNVGMKAPLYYGIKMEDGKMKPLNNTTLTLRIGDWFEAPELIVSSVSGITFSKEVIAPPPKVSGLFNTKGGTGLYDNSPKGDDYGYPLWGKCSLTLVPFSMMNKTKFESYFIDKTTDTAVDGIIGNLLGGIGVNNVVNFADTTIDRFTLP
jgi:hypothetical protein